MREINAGVLECKEIDPNEEQQLADTFVDPDFAADEFGTEDLPGPPEFPTA